MRLEDISSELRERAFEFFYCFSRFEFALKENRFLKDEAPGARAEPGWENFITAFEDRYHLTEAGRQIIAENPQRQIVGYGDLVFRDVGFDDKPSDLGKVVRLLKTVRNNLFHGGKHGAEDWDKPKRNLLLLSVSICILNEFAELAGIEADYNRYY